MHISEKKIWTKINTYMQITKSITLEETLESLRRDLSHEEWPISGLWSQNELEKMKNIIVDNLVDKILLKDNF